MIAPLLLDTLLVLSSPDASATAAEVPPEPAGELAEAPVLDDAAEGQEAIDPTIAAVLAKLTPAEAEALQAMTEAEFDALVERMQSGAPLSATEQAIADAFQAVWSEGFEAELDYRSGDIELADGLAVLHLGEDFRYLGPGQTDKILSEAWGNPPGSETLGMIFPADVSPLHPELGWGVVITYAADGYVEDDDADDIDYDELLEQMQEGTEEDNASRRAMGYAALHLVGWAEPPRYDEASHRLYWAQELSADGDPEHSLNYAIRVLGRRGVLELNAVAGMSQLPQIRPEMEKVLSRVEFNTGNRYEDFDPDIDDVAAYGIGGLIAGKVLAKAGFFAVLLKGLLAAKKLILVGLVAVGVALKKLLGRRREDDPS